MSKKTLGNCLRSTPTSGDVSKINAYLSNSDDGSNSSTVTSPKKTHDESHSSDVLKGLKRRNLNQLQSSVTDSISNMQDYTLKMNALCLKNFWILKKNFMTFLGKNG